MGFKNTRDTYGTIAKFFHWMMALIILGLILMGLYMTGLDYSPEKLEIYALHKSFGLLVLWLVGLRLAWRLWNKQPDQQATHQRWEKLLAILAHFVLYVSMVGLPLSGWLMSSAGEYPVPFFGVQMPDLVSKNVDLAKWMNNAHEILAYVLILVIALHTAGALKHHFVDGDRTLKRMMADSMQQIGPYILIIAMGLFAVGILKLAVFDKVLMSEKASDISSSPTKSVQYESLKEYGQWQIVKDQSSLTFRASVYGKEFTGIFEAFDGVIVFDPYDLESSSATIFIEVKDIDSGDAERDSQMLEQEWFDLQQYPQAIFKTLTFERLEENRYIAIGELTIKNRSMPVNLPFQLDIVEATDGPAKAYMNGELTLNRLDFGLGEGRWEAADSVGLDVTVQVKIVANAASSAK